MSNTDHNGPSLAIKAPLGELAQAFSTSKTYKLQPTIAQAISHFLFSMMFLWVTRSLLNLELVTISNILLELKRG